MFKGGGSSDRLPIFLLSQQEKHFRGSPLSSLWPLKIIPLILFLNSGRTVTPIHGGLVAESRAPVDPCSARACGHEAVSGKILELARAILLFTADRKIFTL